MKVKFSKLHLCILKVAIGESLIPFVNMEVTYKQYIMSLILSCTPILRLLVSGAICQTHHTQKNQQQLFTFSFKLCSKDCCEIFTVTF